MIMMGIEDTGEIPFHTVYLHGLIRDERGEKMSKMKGNVLNPLTTLEQYGTDALRFAVSTGTTPGNDIKLTTARLESGRNFANKLYNATRFVIRSVEPGQCTTEIRRDSLAVEGRWILSRLNRTIQSATGLMDDFQFGEAQRQVYEFLWGEFCDWYIEIAKIRLKPGAGTASPFPVLVHVLETSLRLLHPYMPFVTEELWQNLKGCLPAGWQSAESIMVASYPQADETAFDAGAERIMESVVEIIRSVRNVRAEYKVESTRWIEAQVYAGSLASDIEPYAEAIQTLARVKPLKLLAGRLEGARGKDTLVSVLKETEVVIPLGSMVDLDAEKKRIQLEIVEAETAIARLKNRLSNPEFLGKAPPEVIAKERERMLSLEDKTERLKKQISA
jgi:valyl-tRNA synthetase